MNNYKVEIAIDQGVVKIRDQEKGSRVLVIKTLYDAIKTSVDAKVTVVVTDPEGNETIHRYAKGKKVV